MEDSTLDHWRTQGDPLADAAIAGLVQAENPGAVHRLLASLEENDDALPSGLPVALESFLEQSCELPEWTDRHKLMAGQQLFARHGPAMSAALLCGSLPECYAASDGARVLALTERLKRGAQRRIYETAQFLVDIMTPGSLEPQGSGIRLIQRVRLIHASVRTMAERHPAWDTAWGRPVNQEDMLGTQLAFGVAVLDAMPSFGIDVDETEVDAYLHTWAVVGVLLGVDRTLIPHTLTHARALRHSIRRRHHRPSDHGSALAAALVDTLEAMVPGTAFDAVVPALIHHVAGPEVATLLEVPTGNVPHMLRGMRMVLGAADEAGDRSTALARVAAMFSRALIEGLLWVNREGKDADFRIPAPLRNAWQTGR